MGSRAATRHASSAAGRSTGTGSGTSDIVGEVVDLIRSSLHARGLLSVSNSTGSEVGEARTPSYGCAGRRRRDPATRVGQPIAAKGLSWCASRGAPRCIPRQTWTPCTPAPDRYQRLGLPEDVEPIEIERTRSSCRLAAPSIGITEEPCGIGTPAKLGVTASRPG